MVAGDVSWKAYAGREDGREGYQIGDIARHFLAMLRGQSSPHQGSVDDNDRAMLDLKVQLDSLRWHRRRLEAQIVQDEKVAKQLIQAGKKPQAMLALRKKKQHLQLVSDCDGHVAKLEELVDSIEFATVQKDVVDALASGVASLKRIQKGIGSAEYVQQLMDDCEEAKIAQQELGEALAQSGITEDDAEAAAEFDRIREAQALETLKSATSEASASEVTGPIHKESPVPESGEAVAATSTVQQSVTSAPTAVAEPDEPMRQSEEAAQVEGVAEVTSNVGLNKGPLQMGAQEVTLSAPELVPA